MRCTPAQRLAVRLARSSDVPPGDRRERDQLDRIDLDLAEADPVAAALFDAWLLPQPDRERDVPGKDVVAQLPAELHNRHATSLLGHRNVRFVADGLITCEGCERT